MADKNKTDNQEFELLELYKADGKLHSALHVPRILPSEYTNEVGVDPDDIFNIFMGDCSGSMCTYFPEVVKGWQNHVRDRLQGKTKIYVFGSKVTFIREGADIYEKDNLSGGTDLTSALRTVKEEVNKCTQSNVRVFIVTDGEHGSGEPLPETEIEQMISPPGKTISVYLVGIGRYFPVNYSVDLRSNLHNGNANIPVLFWAQETHDIVDQMVAVSEELDSALLKVNLNVEGFLLPGLDKTSSINVGEWLYFEQPPTDLPSLTIKVNDEISKPVEVVIKPSTVQHLLDSIFRQWNSLLIQQHRKKSHVPMETFDLMASLFNYHLDIIKADLPTGNDIKSRLTRKQMKSCEVEYNTLMNKSKSVINIEGKFQDEMELADIILKSTVTNRKYDLKNLKLKGHGQEEYQVDLEDFKKKYNMIKSQIMALPTPSADESCHVTITSTVGDLQDPDLDLIFQETKFDVLKNFTMSGIPVYCPVRDSSQINPWTLVIKHILVTPFTLLSQQVLEHSAAADASSIGDTDKEVILQQDNEKTRFNVIIPVIPANACQVLKPLVLSNFYAMMSTFCILKNPHIIDFNAHLAALACAWMRTVREYPIDKRPQFASERLESIVATANLYMDRPSVTKYINSLINKPEQALMTESAEEFDGKTLKCESLVKPAFFLFLKKDKFTQQQIENLMHYLLYEFIGRCLSSYKVDESEASPFTDFFCEQLTDKDKRAEWLSTHFKTIIEDFQAGQGNLLDKFYTLEDMIPNLRKFVTTKVADLTGKITKEFKIAVNMKQVQKLKNYGSAGDISWMSFLSFAQEMKLTQEKINQMFSPERIMSFVSSALLFRSSRDRLAKGIPSVDDAEELITKKVLQENARSLRGVISKEVESYAVEQWKEAYMKAHSPLVMPLTRKEVIEAAQAKGIQVNEDDFLKVYKRYNDRLGLLRNACQIPLCPHYLQPHNNFNQHLSIEREQGVFPHALHLVARDYCTNGVDCVISEVTTGKHAGTRKRKVPTPPEPSSLQSLASQLESLLKHYSSSLVEEDDEDAFYDCD